MPSNRRGTGEHHPGFRPRRRIVKLSRSSAVTPVGASEAPPPRARRLAAVLHRARTAACADQTLGGSLRPPTSDDTGRAAHGRRRCIVMAQMSVMSGSPSLVVDDGPVGSRRRVSEPALDERLSGGSSPRPEAMLSVRPTR